MRIAIGLLAAWCILSALVGHLNRLVMPENGWMRNYLYAGFVVGGLMVIGVAMFLALMVPSYV